MTSGTRSSLKPGNDKSPVSEADDNDHLPEYQFITFQDPHTLRSRGTQRLIRSHGVRKSLQTRRKKLVQANQNFRSFTFNQTQTSPVDKVLSPRTSSIAINELDPFESLAVNSLRLQALINHSMSCSNKDPLGRTHLITWLLQIVLRRLLNQYVTLRTAVHIKNSIRYSRVVSVIRLSQMQSCLHFRSPRVNITSLKNASRTKVEPFRTSIRKSSTHKTILFPQP